MADVKWIKLAVDVFDDQKIRMIETMPEGDTIIVIWFKLLTLAGKINDGGFVYFVRDIPYTDQMLAGYLNRPLQTVQLALNTFIRFGMIEIVDDLIFLSNWEKHQNADKLDKIREDTRKRVAKHREKKREELEKTTCNVTVTLPVTQCNATEEELEEELEIEKKKKEYSAQFQKFWELYPRKIEKKKAYKCFMTRLNEGFSEDELIEAAKNYADECKKEKRDPKYIKHASTFLGSDTPFTDYLKKEGGNNVNNTTKPKVEYTEEQLKAFMQSV